MLASISNHSPSIWNAAIPKNKENETEHHNAGYEQAEENSTETLKTELPPEEQQKLQYLKSRDQEVKTHEQAHLSAAGSLALGGASFSFEKGSDGVNYAVGGEVNIDTSAVSGDPAATLRKAETILRAALAPANPSAQDRSVANQASAMANKARAEQFQATQKLSENGDETVAGKINFSV
jgi:hypothetical protein